MFAHPIPTRYLLPLLFVAGCSPVHRVSVTVTVPPETDRVIMVGNVPALGNWDPAEAPALDRTSDTSFTKTLRIRQDYIEYKFTRGSWETEALLRDSTIPDNYRVALSPQTVLTHRIPLWRDKIPEKPVDRRKGITGTVIFYDSVYSPQLDNYRTIRVWVPPDYREAPDQYYPVLYLQDGQNVFSPALSISREEWSLDETATELIARGSIMPIIMVAVDHAAERTAEYSPMHRGRAYSDFLIHTVKSWVDTAFRTLPEPEHTAVMGSSMGGIISFHLAWEHPEIFGMAACLSPAFLVDDEEIVHRVRQYSGPKKQVFFILFNGTEDLETRLQPAVAGMKNALGKAGYAEGNDFIYRTFPGHRHTEADWARQSRLVLQQFFGMKK